LSQLQQNRYDQLLRRVGDLKGPGSKVNDALTELFPMFDVENVPAELLFLSGWKLGFGSSTQAAVALNVNHSQLFVPAGSELLCVVTSIYLRSSTAQQLDITTSAAALTTLVADNRQRDSRSDFAEPATCQIRVVNQLGLIVGIAQIFVEADVTYKMEDPNGLWVMTPGSGIRIANNTVNTDLDVNYFWRERVAQPSELRF